MALSKTIAESIEVAEQQLRNALAFAARSERPSMSMGLAKILNDLDQLKKADQMIDKIEEQLGPNAQNNPFFGLG